MCQGISTMKRTTRVVGFLIAALLLASPGLASATQVPAIVDIHVSNDAEEWVTSGQPWFDPGQQTTVFVAFGSPDHVGFVFDGQCVFSLAATHGELFRVALAGHKVSPGQSLIRSAPFVGTWPQAPVEVTCANDVVPSWAMSTIIEPDRFATAPIEVQITTGFANPKVPVQTMEVVVPEVHVAVPPVQVYIPHPTPVAPSYPPVYPDEAVIIHEAPVAQPNCREALLRTGNSASSLLFCDGVNQTCAVALLEAGNAPSSLIFCEDVVDEACAVDLLRGGGAPSSLIFCD